MTRSLRATVAIAMAAALTIATRPAQACSSFALSRDGRTVFGHNLDGDSVVPGRLIVNPRGVFKRGHSLVGLTSSRGEAPPSVDWISRFGSVTFNNLGVNLPDGGVNEAGLFIWEMTLSGTRFPDDPELPRLFMMQWMQLVLDTCSTVAEVTASARRVALDGWSWQFLVADSHGGRAAISFVDGVAVISEGESMPVALLCNAPYLDELEKLAFYRGFGGEYPADLDDPLAPRFVKAALEMRRIENDASRADDLVDEGLRLLRVLWGGSPSQWTVLCEPATMALYFASDVAPAFKTLRVDRSWLAPGQPVRWLDLHQEEAGEVAGRLTELTPEQNVGHTRETLARWWSPGQTPEGWVDLETLIERFAACAAPESSGALTPFLGQWCGSAAIADGDPLPTTDRWRLSLTLEEGHPRGLLTAMNGASAMEAPAHLELSDGVLSFTVRPVDSLQDGYPPGYPVVRVGLRSLDGRLTGSFGPYRNEVAARGTLDLERCEGG